MKKSMSITLNGLVFILEEDAFEELKKYLDSIAKYYINTDEEKEILNDIETSIADKFSEKLKSSKQAITLADVEDVIKVMGTVEEITEEDEKQENEEKTSTYSSPIPKRLYRDTDDAIIAGVASGIAAYFGIDPIFVRLIFIALIFANGFGILAYLVFWIAMPKAETNAQKLEMRGKPVNLSEIEQAVKEKSKTIGAVGEKTIKKLKDKNAFIKILNIPVILFDGLFVFVKKIWKIIFPIASIICGIFALIGSVIGIITVSIFSSIMIFSINSPYIISDLPLSDLSNEPLYYVSVIAFYIAIALPLIFLTALGITMIRRKNSFSLKSSSVLVGIWMLSAIIGSVSALSLAPLVQSKISENIKQHTVTEKYDYKDFNKLYTGGNLDLKITKGENYSIALTGGESDIERLDFNIENGQLQITQKTREENKICIFCNERKIIGEITVPVLDSFVAVNRSEAELAGFTNNLYISLGESAKAKFKLNGQDITGNLSGISSSLSLSGQAGKIDLKMDGSADLIASDLLVKKIILDMDIFSRAELDGQTDELNIKTMGTSNVSALDLRSKSVKVSASGYSHADINASESLDAIASDRADIRYVNDPKNIVKQATGNSTIKKIDSTRDTDTASGKVYIKTDVKQYSPIMSSIRGIGLTPEFFGTNDKQLIYRFSTNQGYLVENFDQPGYTQEIDTRSDNQKIYWTYLPSEVKLDTAKPIYINLKVRPVNEDRTIAETQIEFTVDNQGLVTQK